MLSWFILGCTYFFTNGLMTNTLATIYNTLSLALLCDILITVSYPIVLVKSFAVVFPLRREMCFLEGCVSEGHGWDGAP
jgi:hypothetical protein